MTAFFRRLAALVRTRRLDSELDDEVGEARVDGVVWGLKAMPTRAAALAQACGAAVAKLPRLATEVNAHAKATLANPLAKADEKARAKADMAAVGKVQAEIQSTIQQVQSTATALPTLATEALAKLTTSFAS